MGGSGNQNDRDGFQPSIDGIIADFRAIRSAQKTLSGESQAASPGKAPALAPSEARPARLHVRSPSGLDVVSGDAPESTRLVIPPGSVGNTDDDTPTIIALGVLALICNPAQALGGEFKTFSPPPGISITVEKPLLHDLENQSPAAASFKASHTASIKSTRRSLHRHQQTMRYKSGLHAPMSPAIEIVPNWEEKSANLQNIDTARKHTVIIPEPESILLLIHALTLFFTIVGVWDKCAFWKNTKPSVIIESSKYESKHDSTTRNDVDGPQG